MHRLFLATALFAALPSSYAQSIEGAAKFMPRDEFFWMEQMNKASAVMVVEQGIVSAELGHKIAQSVDQTIVLGDAPHAPRPDVSHYLTLEQQLVSIGGPDVTRIHSGRSRQDMIATVDRLKLRERSLEWMARLITLRETLGRLAAQNVHTIIPAYTNGVQAQPITLAHYLLGFDGAFERDAIRTQQAYARINLSPLGSAALGISTFPVNRARLAKLLGFDGVVEDSFDANLVSSLDVPLESVQIAQSTALSVGALIEDIELQYHESQPWILLREGALTGPSSIMPQKRNPYGLIEVRKDASDVVGLGETYELEAHNAPTGVSDYKHGAVEATVDKGLDMLEQLNVVLNSLVIDPERSLAEVNGDYSTTTELADELQQRSNIPFRVGHHFASELVTYGRAHHLKPSELPYAEAQRIYTASAASFGMENAQLPLSEEQFRTALTPENMVNSAQVEGGPQPKEVERMLGEQQNSIAADRAWLAHQQAKQKDAQSALEEAFKRL